METKEFLMTLGKQYGLKIDEERAESRAQNGGPLNIVQIVRTLLFQVDVLGYRPKDEPDFGLREVRK